LFVTAATFCSGVGAADFALATSCFEAFGASTGAFVGALLTAGAGVEASCAGGVAEADASSMYSHAVPIAGANPKTAIVLAANSRFMIASS
jgi:hypothetical protein